MFHPILSDKVPKQPPGETTMPPTHVFPESHTPLFKQQINDRNGQAAIEFVWFPSPFRSFASFLVDADNCASVPPIFCKTSVFSAMFGWGWNEKKWFLRKGTAHKTWICLNMIGITSTLHISFLPKGGLMVMNHMVERIWKDQNLTKTTKSKNKWTTPGLSWCNETKEIKALQAEVDPINPYRDVDWR